MSESADRKAPTRAQFLACALQDVQMALGRMGGNYVPSALETAVTIKHADIRSAWVAAAQALADASSKPDPCEALAVDLHAAIAALADIGWASDLDGYARASKARRIHDQLLADGSALAAYEASK